MRRAVLAPLGLRWAALWLAVGLVLAACHRAVPSAGVSVAPVAVEATPATVAGIDVVRQAYTEISRNLFRPVTPRELLLPAWRAVGQEAVRQGIGSLDLSGYQERGSDDMEAFTREFAALVTGPGRGLDTNRVAQAIVRAMAAAVGDSHTRYLAPELAESQRRWIDGVPDSYTGIGIRIDRLPDGIAIAEVYPNSPAERAGLRPGDRILRINGHDAASLALNDVSTQVRGPEGTEVRLTVQRAGEAAREVVVSRARITVPSVPLVTSEMLEADIGYIRVRALPRRSTAVDVARDFDDRLARLLAQGARGLILDLRDNPGGDPLTAVSITSHFVTEGPVFVTVNRDGRRTVYAAVSRPTVYRGPLVVLVNRSTASGAEVIAASVQEYGLGYLIGTRTCGCLSVGRPLELADSSSLIITVEQALTGRLERALEGVGLEPDEVVRGGPGGGVDGPRLRAVQYLRGQLR
jgi:carboxyl-terminal processing protease